MSHFHFTRTKRVTGPLDNRVKDRIIGRDPMYVSSGSEHSGHDSDSSSSFSSPCLSNLLHCYLDHEEERCYPDDDDGKECDSGTDSDCDSERTDEIIDNVKMILSNQNVDRFRNVLLSNVLKGVEVFRSVKSNKQILHRNIMFFLQKLGYDVGICKTKWSSYGGLTAGSYEFIDVISNSGVRYLIELNFVGEFEIARETKMFRRLCNNLPSVFVGKNEELKQIVKLISDGARRSLKSKGLLIPPWRKNRFMQNKWFGPYRRTLNYTATNSSSFSVVPVKLTPTTVKCSYVGFNTVSAPLAHAATRSR